MATKKKWAERCRVMSTCELLRKHGYRILSRPKRGDDLWMHVSGVVHTQTEALAYVKKWLESERYEAIIRSNTAF